ncbi:hypothetical protein [Chryseobacterium echinoideorum]|nr:hypothetical protein [Chryseobacterium echinoideorum]
MTFPSSATITERILDGILMSSSDSTGIRLSASELRTLWNSIPPTQTTT